MLKRFPLSRSILLAFSILFLMVTIVICVFLNQYLYKSITEQAQQHLDAQAAAISQQFHTMFDDMNRISVQLYYSDTIVDAFSQTLSSNGSRNYFALNTEIANLIEAGIYPIVGTEITDIIVNLYNDKGFYSSKYYPVSWPLVKQSLQDGHLADINEKMQQKMEFPVVSYLDNAYWAADAPFQTSYLSISRPFRNYRTQKQIGVVEVLMPEKKIREFLKPNDSDQMTLLLNHDWNILYASNASDKNYLKDISQAMLNTDNFENTTAFENSDDDKYYYSLHSVSAYNLKILCVRRYNNQEYLECTMIVVFAGLLLYLLTLLMCFVISKRLSRPMDKIVVSLKEASWDKLEMNLNLDSSFGDFDVLEEAYSAMMIKLHESVNLIIDSRLNEQKATYLALQSQISPHFIYNTIASVSAYAYENGVYKIVDICDKFSELLRYATDYSENLSNISYELEYTENYLELMKIRYENRFFYSISCAEECKDVQIPRLITQTVIENCFKHSFKNGDGPWFISITAYLEDGWWLIDISHNGDPISQDRLMEILRQSEQIYRDIAHGLKGLNLGGLGLLNSITRLKMLYNPMRFEVFKNEDGTNVTRFGGKLK